MFCFSHPSLWTYGTFSRDFMEVHGIILKGIASVSLLYDWSLCSFVKQDNFLMAARASFTIELDSALSICILSLSWIVCEVFWQGSIYCWIVLVSLWAQLIYCNLLFWFTCFGMVIWASHTHHSSLIWQHDMFVIYHYYLTLLMSMWNFEA